MSRKLVSNVVIGIGVLMLGIVYSFLVWLAFRGVFLYWDATNLGDSMRFTDSVFWSVIMSIMTAIIIIVIGTAIGEVKPGNKDA